VKLGVRGKLFAASVGLIVAVVLASGIYLQGQLRSLLYERIESELLHLARSARATLELGRPPATIAVMDPIADRLGAEDAVRVTVIAPDGTVLGDSALPPVQVAAIENHGTRPEVLAAEARGVGSTYRHSSTLERDLLYVAVPFQTADGGRGVVRVARPLALIDDSIARLRLLLLGAGLIGLVVAVLMSGLASHLMSRTLRRLVDTARDIAAGEPHQRIALTSSDELAGLAGSLNQMSEDIERTLSELAGERARTAAVLEALSDAVIAIDTQNDVTLMNRAAVELLGLADEPRGTPLLQVIRAPGLQELIANPDAPGTAEFDLPGTSRRIGVRLSPMPRGGCVLVVQDVTEIRRLETVRRDFVANVSHELRTPVSIVRANAETLLDGAMDDPVHGKRLLDSALRASERLSAIITDLLDLSRLEAGRRELEPRAVQVAEVARRAGDAIEQRASERDTTIEIDIPDELQVGADDQALEQILVNYLENAVKYTPAGGHIWVTAAEGGGRIRIAVSDDGPGIEPRHRARVFERFYRVDPGRSRDMGGTGLGLAIVKHLAEAMGGTVGVDGASPRGSSFWVELLPPT